MKYAAEILFRFGTLPVAALALAACASTAPGSSDAVTDPGSPDRPRAPTSPTPTPAPRPAPPSVAEPEVTYVTEVERFPQLDGSVLVVTTVRGSDGSVFIDEERIPPETADTDKDADGGRGLASTDDAMPGAPDASAPGSLSGENEINANVEPFPACDPAALDHDFGWPPPEPSARIEIPRLLVVGQLGESPRPVQAIQQRVRSALETAGYLDQAYYSIGCDGFAVITRMEQIDRNGEPVEDGLRFTSPGEEEDWSLTAYLTRLFYAPPGYYRQIILAGTDEVYDPDTLAEAPDEAQLDEIFDGGEGDPIAIDDSQLWGPDHKLHALIYEFETQGTRNVKQRRPSPIPAERHIEASGIYEDID